MVLQVLSNAFRHVTTQLRCGAAPSCLPPLPFSHCLPFAVSPSARLSAQAVARLVVCCTFWLNLSCWPVWHPASAPGQQALASHLCSQHLLSLFFVSVGQSSASVLWCVQDELCFFRSSTLPLLKNRGIARSISWILSKNWVSRICLNIDVVKFLTHP